MILLAAIDILGGKAVRLERGRFGTEMVYDEDPLEAAKRWVAEGARALHVVDLDGARSGAPANLEHVKRITAQASVPVQVGGGLRSVATAAAAIDAGADRIVVATAAYQDRELLEQLLTRYGDRVAVSLDARGGRLAHAGWVRQTELAAEDIARRLENRGLKHLIYSSIDRDEMLAGPDLKGIERIASSTRSSLMYSGGIASVEDLEAIAQLGRESLEGVIVGKALYERRFTAREGQEILERCTTSA